MTHLSQVRGLWTTDLLFRLWRVRYVGLQIRPQCLFYFVRLNKNVLHNRTRLSSKFFSSGNADIFRAGAQKAGGRARWAICIQIATLSAEQKC